MDLSHQMSNTLPYNAPPVDLRQSVRPLQLPKSAPIGAQRRRIRKTSLPAYFLTQSALADPSPRTPVLRPES